MSGECQVNVKSQSELDIGGRETCFFKQNRYFRVSFSLKSLNRKRTKTDNDGGHDHGNTSLVRPAQNVEDCPNVSMCRLTRGSGVTPVVSGH